MRLPRPIPSFCATLKSWDWAWLCQHVFVLKTQNHKIEIKLMVNHQGLRQTMIDFRWLQFTMGIPSVGVSLWIYLQMC